VRVAVRWLDALALAAPLGPLAGQSPAGGTLAAELNGRAVELRVARHRQYAAFNAAELAGALLNQGTFAGPYMSARVGGTELILEAGSPFFRFGNSTYQLANSPYQWGGAFWVPSDFLTEWWPRVVGDGGVRLAAELPEPDPSVVERSSRDPSRPMTVIIDPGHGGRDPGTLTRGAREKDIVLAIGRTLRWELASRGGFDPILTRDTDVFIPIEQRSRIAVERGGELFVSIHVNSVPGSSRASGFETYFLGMERSEEAREVALRENSVIQFEDGAGPVTDDLQFILTGVDRNANLVESRHFAGCVQNMMRDTRGARGDRGVKQGKFWVLLGALAEMPSVIVEVGFITNATEREFMLSSSGQAQIAEALADAIEGYKRYLESVAGSGETC
jgi:N-acetylmuramoyl-L-alanine amidase